MGASFQSQVREAMEKRKTMLLNVAKMAITELVDEVLQGAAAPIDTGQFMANMNASIGSPDSTWTMNTDTDGVSTAMKIRQVINSLKLGDVFYLSNAAPYGPILEYGLYRELYGFATSTPRTINGFSTQAPQGVFRVSTAKWGMFVNDAIGKSMNLTEAWATNAPNFARNVTITSISRKGYTDQFGTKYHPAILKNKQARMDKTREFLKGSR